MDRERSRQTEHRPLNHISPVRRTTNGGTTTSRWISAARAFIATLACGFVSTGAASAQPSDAYCRQAGLLELQSYPETVQALIGPEGRERHLADFLQFMLTTGMGGQVHPDHPIGVTFTGLDATLIGGDAVQAQCRIRAIITVTYARLAYRLESGVVVRRAADATFTGPLVYDGTYAGARTLEIIATDLPATISAAIALDAATKNAADLTPEFRAEAERRRPIENGLPSNSAYREETARLAREAEQQRHEERTRRDLQALEISRVQAEIRQVEEQIRERAIPIGRSLSSIAYARSRIEELSRGSSDRWSSMRQDDRSQGELQRRQRDLERMLREHERLEAGVRELQARRNELQRSVATMTAALGSPPTAADASAPSAGTAPSPASTTPTRPRQDFAQAARDWLSQCLGRPTGAAAPEPNQQQLRVTFASNGELSARPELRNTPQGSSDQYRTNALVRLVMVCAAERPIRLPASQHEQWREVAISTER